MMIMMTTSLTITKLSSRYSTAEERECKLSWDYWTIFAKFKYSNNDISLF